MKRAQLLRFALAALGALAWVIVPRFTDARSALPQAGGGVQAAGEPKFRLVRSVSGSKGRAQGPQYVIEDPRSVFYLPGDTKIIVYFEWEGPIGLHHLEGIWKNPEGKVVSLSDFDYQSKEKRFGAYFSVPLSDTLPTGVWSLEARVDGELAGTHTFQILVAARPASASSEKPLLAPADIYRRALAATVTVEGLDADGASLGAGSGFFVEHDLVLTGFENIDGANSVRLTLSDGTRLEADGVALFSRLGDWAFLKVEAPKSSALPIAAERSWQVGDHCYSLGEPQEGSRIIVDGYITGERMFPQVGERLNLSFAAPPSASGSPLLNEYGEIIGMVVVRSMLPGSKSLDATRRGLGMAYPGNLYRADSPLQSENQLAIPVGAAMLKMSDRPVQSFSLLSQDQAFTPPLAGFVNIMRGTVAKQIEHKGSDWEPMDEKFEYSHQVGKIVVFITWNGQTKLKGLASVRLYSMNNQLLVSSRPSKFSLHKGEMKYMTYPLAISTVPPGTYRIDLTIAENHVWRTFIRVVE